MHTSTTSLLRVLLSASVLLVLCALGPAPIRADRYGLKAHTDLQKQDEKTLESEQSPVFKPQVGAVSGPHAQQQMDNLGNAKDTESVFNAAQRTGTGESAAATQVLGAAGARLNQGGASYAWLWAVLLVGGVLAGVLGVKRWADNNIPNAPMPPVKRDSW